jgi:hypothetical protein
VDRLGAMNVFMSEFTADDAVTVATVNKIAAFITADSTHSNHNSGNIQPSSGNIQPSSGNTQPSSGNIQPSSGNIQPSSGNIQPSSGNIQPSSGNIQPNLGIYPEAGSILTEEVSRRFLQKQKAKIRNFSNHITSIGRHNGTAQEALLALLQVN